MSQVLFDTDHGMFWNWIDINHVDWYLSGHYHRNNKRIIAVIF